jgi:predicted metal-dependent peptidase
MPRMFSPLPRVFIAVDTSGSMSDEALTLCLAEVQGVLKSTNADVTVASCDAQVHAVEKVRSIKEAAAALKGGGGTDFVPVFEHIEDMARAPNVVFFFTDGDGPAPTKPPAGLDVVWILVDGWGRARVPYDERGKKVSYGKVVRVPPVKNGRDAPLQDDDDDDDY